jgi:hypothetical protein
MNTFGRDELIAFLHEVDELLTEPVAIEVIGGAAALLAYGAKRPTKDMDCLGGIDTRIREAALHTHLKIPIDRVTVADPPYDYEDRRIPIDLSFRKLSIWVPERHDLLLMKSVRAARHDIEVLQQIHNAFPFDLEILLERFDKEMGQATIDPRILALQFAHIIETLFGLAAANNFMNTRKSSNQ